MKSRIIIGLLCLFCLAGSAYAGKEQGVTTQATYDDGGNDWRPINVRQSTTAVVLISTTPRGSLMDIQTWRNREIVNTSTCATLTLFPDNISYNSYASSYSIRLSSDSSGFGQGDIYRAPHQGAIYGIWGPGGVGCGDNGYGAGGVETYFNERKDKLGDGFK